MTVGMGDKYIESFPSDHIRYLNRNTHYFIFLDGKIAIDPLYNEINDLLSRVNNE